MVIKLIPSRYLGVTINVAKTKTEKLPHGCYSTWNICSLTAFFTSSHQTQQPLLFYAVRTRRRRARSAVYRAADQSGVVRRVRTHLLLVHCQGTAMEIYMKMFISQRSFVIVLGQEDTTRF